MPLAALVVLLAELLTYIHMAEVMVFITIVLQWLILEDQELGPELLAEA
jgi:hypothetical protein